MRIQPYGPKYRFSVSRFHHLCLHHNDFNVKRDRKLISKPTYKIVPFPQRVKSKLESKIKAWVREVDTHEMCLVYNLCYACGLRVCIRELL